MLSAHALAALAEFNAERDAHQSKFDELKAQADKDAQFSMEAFAEDWNKSQFWVCTDFAFVHVYGCRVGLGREHPRSGLKLPSAFALHVVARVIIVLTLCVDLTVFRRDC